VRDAYGDIAAGDELLVMTWLHLAQRDKLRVHPRSDPVRALDRGVQHPLAGPPQPDRPATGRRRGRRRRPHPVRDLEAVDGTPVVDVKPVLHPDDR
jgi:tRNA (Thr-GGU) A37 N-methylase